MRNLPYVQLYLIIYVNSFAHCKATAQNSGHELFVAGSSAFVVCYCIAISLN